MKTHIIIFFLCTIFFKYNLYSINQYNDLSVTNPPTKPIVYEVGFAFGNPSAINLNLIYHHEKLIFRTTGNYLGSLYGVQFDIGYKLYQNNDTYHAFTFASGLSRYPKNNNIFDTGEEGASYDYISLNYIFNYNGLQLGTGLSTGNGNLSSPRVSIQIGFNLQFN